MSRVVFPGKLIGETLQCVFDFGSRLAVGETISSATASCSVYSGVDASPSSVLSGSTSISGTKVTQKVTAGTLGVTYKLICTTITSTSQHLQLSGYLVIVPDTE